jgi:transcriptional regulator with GAF, ATPase, and Fis domain
MNPSLEKLSKIIEGFGKENLSDILHFISTGLKELHNCSMGQIYLEDLYEGMLICHYVTEENQTEGQPPTQFISPKDSLIYKAFYENKAIISWNSPKGTIKVSSPIGQKSGIKCSAVFPISYQLRPIGALSLDWIDEKAHLTEDQISDIESFIATNSPVLEKAKNFHQKIEFSKHLDLAQKKEAALMMVRSAVKLIDTLTLASVLVPAVPKSVNNLQLKTTDMVEVLAAYSKNEENTEIYNTKDQISILDDENLINRILKYDSEKGLVAQDQVSSSIYIENIMNEKFVRKPIAEKLDLVSLYQIPKFHKKTGQFICAVNYYTETPHQFNSFEKRQLEEHASMLEKLIMDEGLARIEIEVLSEIEQLLSDQDTSLQSFLTKIIDKTTELLGAAGGTISILKTIDDKPWLIVEDDKGSLVGAKSKGWKKSRIPVLPVGGEELPKDSRSLTGYCAHLARPVLVQNVKDTIQTKGFYKSLTDNIRSEIAVPIILGNNVLGVINQDSFRNQKFRKEDKDLLQIVARLISPKVYSLIQIENIREEMSQLTRDIEYRDPKVSSYYFGNVIGKSEEIHSLVSQIDIVVQSICNRMMQWENNVHPETLMGLPSLLITGSTGSGKEFFFNNIYSRLDEIFRREKGKNFKLLVKKTNIAAYTGELTYSELFGHKKGAFTGAEFNRCGILEEAAGGVVFMDEIGDIDSKTQVQLLRFLDTGVFTRLGENDPRYSKIFFVAATNKNLREEIEMGRFREDLFHRLNEFSFQIPSLNQRKEDIEDLAIHFLGKLFHTHYKNVDDAPKPILASEAIGFLKSYNYRGNVRELRNILLRAMLFRKSLTISKEEVAAAAGLHAISPFPKKEASNDLVIDQILGKMESGESDFWEEIHKPFKNNQMTRDMVKAIIEKAKLRFSASLPGLAVKMKVCQDPGIPSERPKFVSFKNFLYKTVKITEN